MWFSGGATLTSVSGINWDTDEFVCLHVSDFRDPFTPRNQQGITIGDIELLAVVIALFIRWIKDKGVSRISVSDKADDISRTNKRPVERRIASELVGNFPKWTIHRDLVLIVVWARTYRNVSEDALTRDSVAQIETWSDEMGFARVVLPDRRYTFCITVGNDTTKSDVSPPKFATTAESPMNAVEWGAGDCTVFSSAIDFGLVHYQTRDPRPLV